MDRVAIQARGLVKWFGTGEARTVAVKEANLDAYFGEMLFIVGPSGSGKTTLLSMISGILRPSEGNVLVDGVDIWNLGATPLAEFRLRKIGFVFQDYHLFPRLSTAENVAIPLILKNENWNESLKKAVEYLDIVGLKNKEDLPPMKLSGGEQQRVAIARAIVGHPEVLIFDEPTASLDGETGRSIMNFILHHILDETRVIVVVTHDSRIFEYAHRILRMEDGRITGPSREEGR